MPLYAVYITHRGQKLIASTSFEAPRFKKALGTRVKPSKHDTAIKCETTTGNSLLRFGNTAGERWRERGRKREYEEKGEGNGRGDVMLAESEPD